VITDNGLTKNANTANKQTTKYLMDVHVNGESIRFPMSVGLSTEIIERSNLEENNFQNYHTNLVLTSKYPNVYS